MSFEPISSDLRQLVFNRANGCCEYCLTQRKFSPDPFAVEHIIPKSRAGGTVADNLALSCQGCNGHKFTAIEAPDPVSMKRVKIYHPRQDRWSEHFRWSEAYLRIIGTSATGRATVERLQLNRVEVVNLREVLRQCDLHPPEYGFEE